MPFERLVQYGNEEDAGIGGPRSQLRELLQNGYVTLGWVRGCVLQRLPEFIEDDQQADMAAIYGVLGSLLEAGDHGPHSDLGVARREAEYTGDVVSRSSVATPTTQGTQ